MLSDDSRLCFDKRRSSFGKGFNWIRCSPDRPCPTIPKSVTFGGLGFLFLPDGTRSLSSRELARCSSYPDAFQFTGKFSNAVSCIGNSVPPLFMRAIAEHIRDEILAKADMGLEPRLVDNHRVNNEAG